jgi:hypothetical protein
LLVYWAQLWAALRIGVCHAEADPNLPLKMLKRLLVTPPRFVPSGTKLMVINWGFGHRLPEVV